MKEGSVRFLALEGACVGSIHKALWPVYCGLRLTRVIASTQIRIWWRLNGGAVPLMITPLHLSTDAF